MISDDGLFFQLRENSWWAKIAAHIMGAQRVALVLGSTVHLHRVSEQEFLADKALLRHELCHVQQFREHGFVNFILKYLWESCKKGYYNNKYEIAARAAENPNGLP
jgi:hypothetical protein